MVKLLALSVLMIVALHFCVLLTLMIYMTSKGPPAPFPRRGMAEPGFWGLLFFASYLAFTKRIFVCVGLVTVLGDL